MACDLEAARITSLPDDAFYISDFISEDEEEWLLQKVSYTPGRCLRLSSMYLVRPYGGLKSMLFIPPSFSSHFSQRIHANHRNR